VYQALQKGTYSQPLSVIDLAGAEQGIQRVVSRNDEAGNVDEEGAGDVEEDEEEVESPEAEDHVDLGYGSLLLEVVEGGVFRQLENTVSSALSIFSGTHLNRCEARSWYKAASASIKGCADRQREARVPLCQAGTGGPEPFLAC
jgi:hypothetical protein